jgi:hypothetical protein
MLVAEMVQEAYEKICEDGSNEFSLTLGWTVEKDYLSTTFFRARFITWTPYQKLPFCKIMEELGPVNDQHNYGKVIMR